MIRFGFLLVLATSCLAALAETPADYAWGWTLHTDGEAAAWRIRLEPEIVELLADDEARDLAVFDADDRPMPLLRLPPERLVERSTTTRELRFETRTHQDLEQTVDAAQLSLLLQRPDGTRLELRAPESDRDPRDSAIVYEALIEGLPPEPGRESGASAHWLITQWTAAQPLDGLLACVLKPIDRPDASSAKLEFQSAFETRPATTTARVQVAASARGWHLSCRANALPDDLALERARIESQRVVDHARRVEIPLPVTHPDPGVLQGQIDAPWLSRQLRVRSMAPNQLSTVRLLFRSGLDPAWRRHAEAELSNLESTRDARRTADESAGLLVFDLQRHARRGMQWRMESTPALVEPVEVALQAQLEEWLFLAQGRPPWRLYVGSRKVPPRDPDLLGVATLARLAPAWKLPLAAPGERFEAAGAAALQAPTPPLPWTRWLLWLILISGSVAVAWLALRLLRNPAGKT